MSIDECIREGSHGPALSREDLVRFEHEIGGALPDDYRAFLLDKNGVDFDPWMIFPWHGRDVSVGGFISLTFAEPLSGLRWEYTRISEKGILGLLPFAFMPNGESLMIDLERGKCGVHLGTYEYENQVPISIEVARIADSFSDLVSQLAPKPRPRCEIRELAKNGTAELADAHFATGAAVDANGLYGTLLSEAVRFRNRAVIEVCLTRGASLAGTIFAATCSHDPSLVGFLVSRGADVNEVDRHGKRPLSYICGTALPGKLGDDKRRMRDALLQHGALV